MIVSPKGIFAYAWINKPDSGNKYSDDKFKVTLRVSKDQLESETQWRVGKELKTGTYSDFLDMITQKHQEAPDCRKKFNPVKDGDVEKNKDDEPKFPGDMYVIFKTKFQPGQFDAKRQPVSGTAGAMSGDVGKVAFIMSVWDEGVTLRLKSVQILEKNNRPGGDASMFEDEDGYEAEDQTDSYSDDDDDGDF